MNAEENFDQFGTHMNPLVPVHTPLGSADHHVTDHSRKNLYFSKIQETPRNTMQKPFVDTWSQTREIRGKNCSVRIRP